MACPTGSISRTPCGFDLTLGGSPAEWVTPGSFASSAAPLFRTRAGRTVVLALSNRGDIAEVFTSTDITSACWTGSTTLEAILAGYAGDRTGQTQRIALSAEYAGRWLMETMATDWAAPRLLRCYIVE